MFKKMWSLSLSIILVMGLLAGCGSKTDSTAGGDSSAGEKEVTIKMFTASPEYTDAFHAYIEEYKKVKPNVTIELEIMQADYPTVLKSKIASGNIPDVFQSSAGGEIKQYAEYSADLTNEPLAADMTEAVKGDMSYDGKVLGLPVKSNLFSIIYNKKMFADAGITEVPKTTAQLEDAIAKLEEIGAVPFANGYKDWWTFKHVLQHFIDAESDDPEQLVNDFIAGKTTFSEHPTLMKFFDFVDLSVAHGMDKQLERDAAAAISDFGSGKAAMITGQGAWAEESIMKIDPSIEIGIMGYPINDDPSKSMVITGADQALRINKDSKVLNETLEFFNWLYTSDYGKQWFSQIAKVIPPIKDAPVPDMQMTNAMTELLKTETPGKMSIVYSLDSFYQKLGEIVQAYIGKSKTREQAIDEVQKAWIQLGAPK